MNQATHSTAVGPDESIRPSQAELIAADGRLKGATFGVCGSAFTIGRAASCDLSLAEDPEIPQFLACIVWVSGGHLLYRGSPDGLLRVDDTEILCARALPDRSKLFLGEKQVFEYRRLDPVAACPARTKAFQLEGVAGEWAGKLLTFDREVVSIGRLPANDVVLQETSVSREQARITRRPGAGWELLNVSEGGTYVNLERCFGERLLADGDRLYLGKADVFVFTEAAGAPVDEVPPASGKFVLRQSTRVTSVPAGRIQVTETCLLVGSSPSCGLRLVLSGDPAEFALLLDLGDELRLYPKAGSCLVDSRLQDTACPLLAGQVIRFPSGDEFEVVREADRPEPASAEVPTMSFAVPPELKLLATPKAAAAPSMLDAADSRPSSLSVCAELVDELLASPGAIAGPSLPVLDVDLPFLDAPAEEVGPATAFYLEIVAGSPVGRAGLIPCPDSHLSIGRSGDCWLRYEHVEIRPKHAEIDTSGGVSRLRDRSEGRLLVNQRSAGEHVLADGDLITLCDDVVLQFWLPASAHQLAATERSRDWVFCKLLFLEGEFRGKARDFRCESIMLGRLPACDVVFSSEEVSREHVKISKQEGKCVLTPQSRNPTELNGVQIDGEVELLDRDEVTVPGGSRFTYIDLKEAAARRASDGTRTRARRPIWVAPGAAPASAAYPSWTLRKLQGPWPCAVGEVVARFCADSVSFGRLRSSDFFLQDPHVSASQLRVTADGPLLVAENLGKRPSMLDGKPLTGTGLLRQGSRLAFPGGVEVEVDLGSRPEPVEAPKATGAQPVASSPARATRPSGILPAMLLLIGLALGWSASWVPQTMASGGQWGVFLVGGGVGLLLGAVLAAWLGPRLR